jgi:uncharacterized protein (TIGR03382 family)
MAESTGAWMAKTIALVILAAVATALLTTGIQMLVWKKTNSGVSGGAAAGVAVAVVMSRRRRMREQQKANNQTGT